MNDQEEKVILVDTSDNFLGLMPKLEAHEKGVLHRAFSIFIFNDKQELLLQQRALGKYHSPGLWTNTCCSHPRSQETVLQAATRRLQEEMGFTTALTQKGSFIYKADFPNGLIEHEYDHIVTGIYNQAPVINPHEVHDWKWVSLADLEKNMQQYPQQYTPWFRIIFEKYQSSLRIT